MNWLYYAAGLIDGSSLPHRSEVNNADLQNILNIIFVTLGAFGFLLIVIAGFRYVLAGGDAQKVATARATIAYTIVGLVVVGSAAAIVNLVLGRVK